MKTVPDIFAKGEPKHDRLCNMTWDIAFNGVVEKFPGNGGWVYVAVPEKHTIFLQKQRRAWGMYPITAHVGKSSWNTKLMIKKGGNFFVALNVGIRTTEKIAVGDIVTVSIKLR